MLYVELKSRNNQHNKQVGKTGEEIASKFLRSRGFDVLEMNYLKKWGEIDIVSRETGGKVHFIEVKTVSYETKDLLKQAVTRRTWRPEENVHREKMKRLSRAIESWLMKNNYKGEWQIDVLAVRIVPREKYATVKSLNNVILET